MGDGKNGSFGKTVKGSVKSICITAVSTCFCRYAVEQGGIVFLVCQAPIALADSDWQLFDSDVWFYPVDSAGISADFYPHCPLLKQH